MLLKLSLPILATALFQLAQANPAVTELNGKVSTGHGEYNKDSGYFYDASITTPLLDNLGFQLDGLYQRAGGETFQGIGGQLFWRDANALLGGSAGIIDNDNIEATELSLMGEYFLENFTLGAKAGWSSVSFGGPFGNSFNIDPDEKGAYGKLYLIYYPSDNMALTLTGENRFDATYFEAEAEYALPLDGLTVFASMVEGENHYEQNFFGLRYYFGASKSLKQRHRLDDPANMLHSIFKGIGQHIINARKADLAPLIDLKISGPDINFDT
jgi:hypothetical protein